MKVIVASGRLPDRDASLSEIPRGFFKEVDLSVYQKSTEMKIAKQEGIYKSRQGPTITPIPFWAVEFQTIRRKTGDTYQILPVQKDGQYLVATARWASEVTGTGVEKKKWRHMTFAGPCSPNYLFAVATSAWLVPFALAHRYLVYLPAEVSGTGKSADIRVRHDFTTKSDGLDAWTMTRKGSDTSIQEWTSKAQDAWTKTRTDRSTPLVTNWLDYIGKLSSQRPNAFRVVHTRSRSFYAAVLDPASSTALGLPYNSARIRVVEGGKTIKTIDIPIAGVICDNLLHSIVVDSQIEAYWMMGLFNSETFNRLVMKEAKGEPPGIYTIPVKVMQELELVFNSKNPNFIELAKTAKMLEERMRKALRTYLSEQKGVDIQSVDDSDQSQEIPSTISSALMRRLDAEDELERLNLLADKIIRQ